ncbi:hypothetical protein ZYGR_0H04260 [Zygosaccharomyces rouxii]|uniref:Signal peptidase complex subunit 2 n=2 Tax=Zygosaccharomyces rouxii TaxID=4956 RepID=C5DS47_ZYGRC|nr:uncharacterized protein ZYRO0B13794g [Zygosaccharomyces rouxii]KAH9199863.1 signal peptidase complex subunit 2 [Zygosaccharomyces rouxii]GAV47580.1 hypothetical protein ZYGR_0H04260 [Zygosaccharomyces rouxii]CAR26608.1 ZYRO0B13794p [Zygosaccharomyces rouxii]
MSKPINIYSIPELRQTLDEALPGIFSRYEFNQSFRLIDSQLVIGYGIALVAAASFLLDKKFEFEEVLTYQKILVGSYMVLSTVYWYFTKFVQKGITYEGVNKKGTSIAVKTFFENNEPLYHITFMTQDDFDLKTALPVNKVFNEHGYLQTDLLYQWIGQQLTILETKKAK